MDIRGKGEKAKEAFGAMTAAVAGAEAPAEGGAQAPAAAEPAASPEPSGKGAAKKKAKAPKITDIEGVGPKAGKMLKDAGYDTIAKIKELTFEDLVKLDGIGRKTAEKILKSAKGLE